MQFPATSVHLGALIGFLDELLEPRRFRDLAPNGLQVPGRDQVETLVTGVSANLELFERAADEGADCVLVHHGLFWKGMPQEITASLHRRLKVLFDHDMALAAYHLPLDAHPEVGNNALLARALGCENLEPFAEHGGATIGMAGRFPGDGLAPEELVGTVTEVTGREPLAFLDGPGRVRSIGVVTGAAPDGVHDALAAGLDGFLTGEPAERVMGVAREEGIHFLAAGHYATETFGVRRLGELLQDRWGIRHIFVDVPNPI